MFNIFNIFNKKQNKNYLENISILLSKTLKIYNLSYQNEKLSLHKSKEFTKNNSKIKISISFIKLHKYSILPYASIDHIDIDKNTILESIHFIRHTNELVQSYTSQFDLKVKYFNGIDPSLFKKIINYLDSLYIEYV